MQGAAQRSGQLASKIFYSGGFRESDDSGQRSASPPHARLAAQPYALHGGRCGKLIGGRIRRPKSSEGTLLAFAEVRVL